MENDLHCNLSESSDDVTLGYKGETNKHKKHQKYFIFQSFSEFIYTHNILCLKPIYPRLKKRLVLDVDNCIVEYFLRKGLTGAEQNLYLLTWSECCLVGTSRCCDEKMFSLTYQMKGKFIDLSTTYYPIYLYLTRLEYSFQPNCLITTNDKLSAFGFDNKKREQRVWPKCQRFKLSRIALFQKYGCVCTGQKVKRLWKKIINAPSMMDTLLGSYAPIMVDTLLGSHRWASPLAT